MAKCFALPFCVLACLYCTSMHADAQDVVPHASVNAGADHRVGFLNEPRPGHWLAQTDDLGVWWCESGWKIGRERGLPEKPHDGRAMRVEVSAACGEFEPVQVILRPEKDGELLSATLGPFRNAHGNAGGIEVRLDEVAYVNVIRPTDKSSQPGWYPDPLPPLRTPLALHAGQNQPLWITFHVSRFTPAGHYRGELELQTTLGAIRAPLSLHVYDFALPEQTHLKSALGLGTREINRYHKLIRPEDQQAVFEKYLSQVERHLRERGWLDKAFTYWFDEPDPKD